MSSTLAALCFGARDLDALARFWAGVLERETAVGPRGSVDLVPALESDLTIRFVPLDEPRRGPNQIHFDLTSASRGDQQAIVDRALGLGGAHLDVGQRPEEGHVVLADPEGNEFCVIAPGNSFLAGTASIGALSSDGTPEVGRFWSAALGWPLVWDQDDETGIQSPRGGSKISWGGPPYREKLGRNRLYLALAPSDGDDVQAEVDRLASLGASRAAPEGWDPGGIAMTDPDGNELVVLER